MAKKTQKTAKPDRAKIVGIALTLAAKNGWTQTSLADIAKAAKISLAALHEMFEDKADILGALGRIIDARTLENVDQSSPDLSPRDRLFDIMMERFDVLNDYRAGVTAILDSFLLDPKQAVIGLPHLCRSMTWMLEAAGIATSGIPGAFRVMGLTVVYLDVLRVWKEDISPDMGKTMAALDKDLGRAEKLASFFVRG